MAGGALRALLLEGWLIGLLGPTRWVGFFVFLCFKAMEVPKAFG